MAQDLRLKAQKLHQIQSELSEKNIVSKSTNSYEYKSGSIIDSARKSDTLNIQNKKAFDQVFEVYESNSTISQINNCKTNENQINNINHNVIFQNR